MTKACVEIILKRYAYIVRGVMEERKFVAFYVGKRRQMIEITEEARVVCRIIEDIAVREVDVDVRCMIDGIKKGRSDIAILHDVNWEKNAYYDRKKKFIDKVYNCCICLRLVSYEEIINQLIR